MSARIRRERRPDLFQVGRDDLRGTFASEIILAEDSVTVARADLGP